MIRFANESKCSNSIITLEEDREEDREGRERRSEGRGGRRGGRRVPGV